MQKLRRLKKKLVKEAGIFIGIIAVLTGVTLFLQDEIGSEEQQQNVLRSNIQSLDSQIAELERKHGIVNSSIIEYNRLKARMGRGDFRIDRDQATDIFDTLRKKYRISNLSMTVTPKDVMRSTDLERPTAEVTVSEASLEFDAMSDVHVFSFLHDAMQTLPGFLRVTRFKINRQRLITPDVYVSVSKGEVPRMVSAEVGLMWLGIDEKSKEITGEINAQNP